MVECDAYDPVAELVDSTILGQDWVSDWDTAKKSAVNIAMETATTQGLESRSTQLHVPSLDTKQRLIVTIFIIDVQSDTYELN